MTNNGSSALWTAVQIGLVGALATAGAATPWIGVTLALDPPVIGALSGALLGSSATMLGTLVSHWIARGEKKLSDAERRASIKAMITVDLINLSIEYFDLFELLRLVQKTIANGGATQSLDFLSGTLHTMSAIEVLRAEIILLPSDEVRVLADFENNIRLTKNYLHKMTQNARPLDAANLSLLSSSIATDMRLLSKALSTIAPKRKLRVLSGQEYLVEMLLGQQASELEAGMVV
ncbi:MAG: hypothetical protein WDN69_20310 [Aliidongia sp.]